MPLKSHLPFALIIHPLPSNQQHHFPNPNPPALLLHPPLPTTPLPIPTHPMPPLLPPRIPQLLPQKPLRILLINILIISIPLPPNIPIPIFIFIFNLRRRSTRRSSTPKPTPRKNQRMLRLKRQPIHSNHRLLVAPTMIQLGSSRYRSDEERHAIVVERRAPLPHGRVDGVEDVVCILKIR